MESISLDGRNNPYSTKEQDKDESGRKKSSPSEQKIKLGMNLAERNNPYSTKEQDKDESGRKKSSLRNKRVG